MVAGCNADKIKLTGKKNEVQLKYVQITFDNGEKLTGYVKELGIGKDTETYNGGSTRNYLYNQKGQVIGCFNYNRVMYIKLLSPPVAHD